MTTGGFQPEITRFIDGLVASGEAVGGGDSFNGGVEAFVGVLRDLGDDDTNGLFASAGSLRADGFGLKGLVPALDLSAAWKT